MRILVGLLLMAAFAGAEQPQPPEHPQPARIASADIVDAGIYRSEQTGTAPAPETALGERKLVANVGLVQATTRIPARIGTHFGVRFRLNGEPEGATLVLKCVVIAPPSGMRNPRTGETTVRQEYSAPFSIGHTEYVGMLFEHDWELVPGTWTFEIWDGDRRLVEQDFDVVTR